MSNEEKQARQAHQEFRKKWIKILTDITIVLSFIFLTFLVLNNINEKVIYITYTENSNVDYKVYLKDNEFFEEEYLGKRQAYVASLIDDIMIDFKYDLNMSSKRVQYKYSYSIDAQLEVFDKDYKKPLYNPKETLVKEQIFFENGTEHLTIKDNVTINYDEFNQKAKAFIEAYELRNVSTSVIVTMHINVTSSCDEFQSDATDNYSISLTVPLVTTTTDVTFSSSVAEQENKIIACNNSITSSQVFKVLSVIFGIIDGIALFAVVGFMYYTYDANVDYATKVNRVMRNYKSFIQPIGNQFDISSYQVLEILDINRLLEIRDTLQKPILCSENEDKTCANFFIVAEDKVLYLYQIKVEKEEQQ